MIVQKLYNRLLGYHELVRGLILKMHPEHDLVVLLLLDRYCDPPTYETVEALTVI